MKALSIVVPAYNEAARLAEGLRRLTEAMAHGAVDPKTTEVIVVDDGSTDGTDRAAAALTEPLPHHRLVRLPANRGKGAAVRAGVRVARGRVIAYMDADMAIHPDQVPALVDAVEAGADVAIGSRAVAGRGVVYATRLRTLEGRVFNVAVNALTGVRLGDTQCGFKAFRAPAARLLFGCTTIDRFAFDMEVLSTARRLGLRVTEVPVRWSDVPGSRIRPLRDPASMLADLVASRSGRRGAPPLAALEVTGADGAAVQAALDDPSTPVLESAGGALVVLVPGTGDPPDADALSRVLAASVPGASVRRTSIGVAGLSRLAPLALLEMAASEVGTMTECQAPGTSSPGTAPRP